MALNLKGSIAWTVLISAAGFLLSFTSQIIISYNFGTSSDVDAYWVAFALMNLLALPLIPLREALVPEFHRLLREDQQIASAYFSRAMTLILLVGGAGGLIGLLLSSPLVALAVSGKQLLVRSLAVDMFHWLLPALMLLAVSETLNAILAAYHRVVLQALVRFLGAATTLVVLFLFSGVLSSHVLPIGLIAAQVTTTTVQILALRNHGLSFKFAWPSALGKRFLVVNAALLVNYAAGHVYALFEKHTFTSFATGLVSSFQYAVSLTNVLITLVGVTLSSALWPRLLEHAAKKDRSRLYSEVSLASKLTFLVMGWLCSLIWLNATALIELIYARGNFDAAAVTRTAEALRMSVFAAVPVSVNLIIGRSLVSLGAARSAMVTGLITALVGGVTLTIARLIGSPTLAFSHWLLANLAGLIVQTLLLARICGGFTNGLSHVIGWLARSISVLAIAGFATLMIPATKPSHVASLSDIVLRFIVFSSVFVILVLISGLSNVFRTKKG